MTLKGDSTLSSIDTKCRFFCMPLILVPLLAAAGLAAEPFSLPRTSVHRMTAASNGIDYKLYVSLPRDYENSKTRFPVIYLLDADYSFAIAHNVVEHMADREHLRWAIVVGIAYDGPDRYRLNRTRDYTPKFSPEGGYGAEYQKVSGGGPKFRQFLEKELIPFVDATWRSSAERVLVGHSYGGLFAAWTLLTSPELFDGYIIVSPSLWYADKWIFQQKQPAKTSGARAYLTVGSMEGDGENMQGDLARLAKLLRSRSNLAVRHEVLPEETHNSLFPSAFSRGIRFVLKGR